MNICKYDIYFVILLCFIIYLYLNKNKQEEFQSTASGYQADIEAIRNLSSIATQLTTSNNLTMPGTLNVTNSLSANDNISVTNKTNEGGRIRILNSLKDGKKDHTNDWSIWNMTGGYGNKLSFWRYNGDGANAGPVMDLNDVGNVKVYGDLNTTGSTNIKALNTGGGTNNNPGGKDAPWGTHFPYLGDGNNYIRGNTIINGNVNMGGNFDLTGNLNMTGNLMLNTFYRKYMNAGIFQVKGHGRYTDLKYGWTIMWEDGNAFNVSARLSLYEKISGRNGFVTVAGRDLRPGSDGNWHPHRLVVFPGYCVRFYYWDQPSTDNCKFNAGYYDWVGGRFGASNNQCIHLIHVTLDSEGISNFDDLTCARLSDYGWSTNRFPVRLPGKNRTVNEAWYTDA